MFMLVAWVMGIGIGLIFTFLFWHLQVKRCTQVSVARSGPAFTATSAQNHGHFDTFHGHIP
jgi:hypothetical protein